VRLKDRVMVVTGGTRGIGWAIAQAAASEGATVVICSRDETAVREKVSTLKETGGQASGIAADISRENDLEKLIEHTISAWGRLDIWVNNAGVSAGRKPFRALSMAEIDRLVGVNLAGTLKAARLVLPYFVKQGGGILLNMSGKGGDGHPAPFNATYAATKAAVVSLTRSLAQEYRRHPVSIHSISPGMVATDFYKDVLTRPEMAVQANKLASVMRVAGVPPEAVGRLVVEVASQRPGQVTGKNYSVIRGRRKWLGVIRLAWYRLNGKI